MRLQLVPVNSLFIPRVTVIQQLLLTSVPFGLVVRARTWGDVGGQPLSSGPVSDLDWGLGSAGTLLVTEFLYL